MIGDRSIQEKDFGRIRIDRIKERDSDVGGNLSGAKFSIVAANNHYAGFGPGTVNIFRYLLDLEEVKWGDDYVSTDDLEKEDNMGTNRRLIKTKQTSLFDFFN